MLDPRKGHHYSLWLVEGVAVFFNQRLVDEGESLFWTEQWIAQGVVLICCHMDEFAEDQLWLGPYFIDLVVGCLQLLLHF